MSAGRTPLDMVIGGNEPDVTEDHLRPGYGKQDEEAEDNAHGGGTDKAPDRVQPFTIREG